MVGSRDVVVEVGAGARAEVKVKGESPIELTWGKNWRGSFLTQYLRMM